MAQRKLMGSHNRNKKPWENEEQFMDYVEWWIDTLTKEKGRDTGHNWDVFLFFAEKIMTPRFESSLDHLAILS